LCCLGQLGHGDIQHRSLPEKISTLKDIVYVICGRHNSFFQDIEGRVFACGYNEDNQIRESRGKVTTPVECENLFNKQIIPGNTWTLGCDQAGNVSVRGSINQDFNIGGPLLVDTPKPRTMVKAALRSQ
jgi:alpha-tubulin suppressor-like RCC1 family protein